VAIFQKLIMRPSVIAGKEISRIIILLLVISTFVLVAGALYVAIEILPPESLSRLSSLLLVMIALMSENILEEGENRWQK